MLQEYNRIETDDTLRETLAHGSRKYPFAYYPEDVWHFDFHCVDWHWHHEVEFVSVEKGKLTCLIGEERIELPEGCGLFVNSGVFHRYEAEKGNVFAPNIVFSPALLAPEESLIYEKYVLPVIRSAVPCQIFVPQEEWQKTILETLSAIYGLQEDGEKNELRTLSLVARIWEILFAHWNTTTKVPERNYMKHRQAKLRIMMQYIHDHYSEPVTLQEIAAAASVSKSSALNIFQAGIHLSPVSYLIRHRLICACKLLHTTEKTVTAIAEETGFSNAGYFCRKFREHYHMSPLAYKRNRMLH